MSSAVIFLVFTLCIAVIKGQDNYGKLQNDITKRKECGLMKIAPGKQSKILHGKNSHYGEYPWQVALSRNDPLTWTRESQDKVFCGGSLLNNQWVVTAAHCIDLKYRLFPEDLHIVLGEHNLISSKERHERVLRVASKVIRHPNYDYDTYHYDVGLIKLDSPVDYQDHIQPICMPTIEAKRLIGKFVIATGWGRYFEKGRMANILQEVALPVIHSKNCELIFLKGGEDVNLEDFFICAGFKHGKRDTCAGDSGGPLQYRAPDGHWELMGIVSWGYGCGRPLKPGLSTRVGKVQDWVKATMLEYS